MAVGQILPEGRFYVVCENSTNCDSIPMTDNLVSLYLLDIIVDELT